MAEEVKNTTADDATDDSLGRGEVQDAKVVEEKGAENTAVEGDAGTVASDEEVAGKGGTDAGSASLSDSEGVEGEPAGEEKAVTAEETETAGEVAEEASEEKGEEEKVAEAVEGQTEDETAGEGGPAEKEAAAEEGSEKDKPLGEEAVVAEGETEAAGEAVEEASEEEGEEEKVAEAVEGQTEDDTAGEGEPAEKEDVAEEGSEKGEPAGEETVIVAEETESAGEPAEEVSEEKGAEEKVAEAAEGQTEDDTAGEETVVAEGENEVAGEPAEKASEEEGSVSEKGGKAGLVSSEELSGETEEDVTDEEWVVWKNEFINRFHKRFDKKWVLPGIGVFVALLVIAGFFMVTDLRFADTGEVKFLEEIAGPVCDMKFFLPLSVGSGKKRFVKVTVVIELVDKGYKKEIDKKVSEIREEVINLVLAKSPQEVKSSKGKELLRKEITAGLNKYLAEDCVKNTYFTELIVL